MRHLFEAHRRNHESKHGSYCSAPPRSRISTRRLPRILGSIGCQRAAPNRSPRLSSRLGSMPLATRKRFTASARRKDSCLLYCATSLGVGVTGDDESILGPSDAEVSANSNCWSWASACALNVLELCSKGIFRLTDCSDFRRIPPRQPTRHEAAGLWAAAMLARFVREPDTAPAPCGSSEVQPRRAAMRSRTAMHKAGKTKRSASTSFQSAPDPCERRSFVVPVLHDLQDSRSDSAPAAAGWLLRASTSASK